MLGKPKKFPGDIKGKKKPWGDDYFQNRTKKS